MRAVVVFVLVAFVAGCGGSSAPTSSIRKRRKRRRQPSVVPTHRTSSSVTKPATGTRQPVQPTQRSSGEFIPGQERVPLGASKELWDAWKGFQKAYLNWRKKWDAMVDRKESGKEIALSEINSMLSETRSLQRRMFEVRKLADGLKGKDSLAEGVVHEIDRDAAVNLGRAVQTLLDWRSASR